MYSKNKQPPCQRNRFVTNKDFAARLNFFVNNYYLDVALRLGNTGFSGELDRSSLFIRFDEKINTRTLDEIKDFFSQVGHQTNDVHPPGKEMEKAAALLEVVAHEAAHLLQMMLCPSVHLFHKASRKMAVLRAQIFGTILRQGIKRTHHESNLFEFIPRFAQPEDEFFSRCIAQSRMETRIGYNFISYDINPDAFNSIDICEGSAMAFQKIASMADYLLPTSEVPGEKRYFGTWGHYKKQGGALREVFFLLTHLSLKYGCLDNGDYMGACPTPQQLFTALCDNIGRYENILTSHFFFAPFGYPGLPPVAEKLCLRPEAKKMLERVDILMWTITNDLRTYNRQNNIYHDISGDGKIMYDNSVMFAPIRAIEKEFFSTFPEYKENYFLALLLIDPDYRMRVITALLHIVKTTNVTGVFGSPTTISADHEFLCLIDDVDEYMRSDFSFCCNRHKGNKSSKAEIAFCNNPYGVKSRFRKITNAELDEFF